MPRPPCPPADFEHAIEDYVAGESAQACAARWHTTEKRLADELKRRGLFRTKAQRETIKAQKVHAAAIARAGIDPEELAARYAAGESENALAAAFGVSRTAITMRLKAAGSHRRTQTEANRLLAEQTPDEEHLRRIAIAQEASRGRKHTAAHRCKIAQSRQQRPSNVSPAETMLAEWLAERGLPTVSQQAVGPYNVDLGAAPVAVEVLGGSWHAGKKGHAQRTRDILDAGWHLVFVWTHPRRSPLQPGIADYVVAFAEELRRDPPAVGQYRVVRGDGQELARGSADADDLSPVVPGYESYGRGS